MLSVSFTRVAIAASAVLFTLCSSAKAMDAADCKDALIQDTYSNSKSLALDWRLAEFVSQSDYDKAKSGGGVNAVIYGIPVGANYSDFREKVRLYQRETRESLTLEQASNILWTSLSDNSVGAYKACIEALILTSIGLHLTVIQATESDVTLKVTWTANDPTAKYPSQLLLSWSGANVFPGEVLPQRLKPNGYNVIRLSRPLSESSVAVNADGAAGDSVVLTPLPKPVVPPCVGLETARAQFETNGDLNSNNFSIIVPECGKFVLKAELSNYVFGPDGPIGPDTAATPRTIEVTRTLCVQQLSDAKGPFVRVHINRGCDDRRDLPDPKVFYRRSVSPAFSDSSVSNWGEIASAIRRINSRF